MEVAMNLADLNERTIRDVYPLPLLRDNLDALNNALFLSTIDICGAYLSITIAEDSRDYFAFITHCGLYRWKVLPYGYRNAGAIFCRVIANLLAGLLYIILVSYVDDICIFGGRNFFDNLRCHNVIFNRLQKAGLRVSLTKCYFFMKQFIYLGYTVSTKGVSPAKKNVEKLKNSIIETVADVRSFLGMAGFYRKWIKDYSKLTTPLYDWVKASFPTASTKVAARKAATTIIDHMVKEPIMSFPQFEDHFYLETDGSVEGFGAVLYQLSNGNRRIIGYGSTGIKPGQKHYGAAKLEASAAVWGMCHFRHYLENRTFTLRTDNAVMQYIGRHNKAMEKWAIECQDFDYIVEQVPGRKVATADFLSRTAARQAEPEPTESEPEDPETAGPERTEHNLGMLFMLSTALENMNTATC
jgi:hypothetical protein